MRLDIKGHSGKRGDQQDVERGQGGEEVNGANNWARTLMTQDTTDTSRHNLITEILTDLPSDINTDILTEPQT